MVSAERRQAAKLQRATSGEVAGEAGASGQQRKQDPSHRSHLGLALSALAYFAHALHKSTYELIMFYSSCFYLVKSSCALARFVDRVVPEHIMCHNLEIIHQPGVALDLDFHLLDALI